MNNSELLSQWVIFDKKETFSVNFPENASKQQDRLV